MKDYAAKAMELAPRDIVARAIQTEVDEGRGFNDEYVHLDLTHLGADRINERLPGIRQIAMDFASVDPIKEPLPVQPGQHYSMGGVACGADTATPLPGLYSAGECSCVSVHGANRLGGNSLLETVVFGKQAGIMISKAVGDIMAPSDDPIKDALKTEDARLSSFLSRESGERISDIRDGLMGAMFCSFGVFRNEKDMMSGLDAIRSFKDRFSKAYIDNKGKEFNFDLVHLLELEFLLDIAEPLALGAIARKESRGSHFRPDYPERDDKGFLKHTMAFLRDGRTVIEYSDVTLGMFEVKERVY
jgi:succinate dehydrogenase / fumarate reductase flavoprotein subunit